MAVAGYGLAWLPRSLITEELAAGELVPAGDSFWHMALRIRLYRCNSDMTPQVKNVWSAASTVARQDWAKGCASQDGTSDPGHTP
jgi:DNA-binding transcriptional LysR family regulator